MFEAVEGYRIDWIINGIIVAVVFGCAAGNYACSLVFRLPRGRLILDKTPYCGTCAAPLQVKDLFPVISAVLLKHKCRYCHTSFPVSHTWTEILVGLLFVLTFLRYGFGEQYLLVVLLGVFLVTQAAIEANEKRVIHSVMICVLICGMVFRTLQDHSMFVFFQGGLVALVTCCVIWRKQIRQVGHIYVPPDHVFMITVGAVCVGLNALPAYLLLLIVIYAADRFCRFVFGAQHVPLASVTVGLATILLVLYPQIYGATSHMKKHFIPAIEAPVAN